MNTEDIGHGTWVDVQATSLQDPILDHAVALTHAILRERGAGITPEMVPSLLKSMYNAVRDASKADEPEAPVVEKATPKQIRDSVTPDYVVCLEDGKKFKSLKRHLRTHYSLTPEEYRSKWGLPADHPIVAPNYAAVRSKLAKANGLGRK